MTAPRVSIIIPCYHSEKHIGQCIDSLISQTYTDWEAIFVDDKPSKEMIDIMAEYSGKDSRIRYYVWWRKTTPAHARNQGIDYAVGRYITFLDADDWWTPYKLTTMVEYLDKHPEIEWCAHYIIRCYPRGLQVNEEVYQGHDMSIGGTGAIMIRKPTLSKFQHERGYIFYERLDRNDDADLILYIRHLPSALLQYHLSYMRMRDDGLTSATTEWERLKIITGMGIRNKAYGLIVFHTVLVMCHLAGIDPVKVKRRIFNET